MVRAQAIVIAAATSLAGCATPGIDYEARIMPKAPAAAELRNISVHRFEGPSGRWFSRQLEAVLASAQFDGTYWFNVSGTGAPQDGPPAVYDGFVEITDVDEYYSENVRHRCVKKDEDGKCVRKKRYVEYCVTTDVAVAAYVELTRPESETPVFSAAYPGSARDYACSEYVSHYDSYNMAHAIRRLSGSPLGFHNIGYGYGSPGALVREALADTLGQIRRDVAPRNAIVRAEFVTKAIDPAVKADARFSQAIKLGRSNPATSCELWTALGETYPYAPSVSHNLGACAEASGDYARAQSLYAQASEFASRTAGGYEVFKEMTASLSQISKRRADLISLNELTDGSAEREPDS